MSPVKLIEKIERGQINPESKKSVALLVLISGVGEEVITFGAIADAYFGYKAEGYLIN
ncbi:hypothetical protein [Streptococcus sobrinus]|uniref:hypothetical protein n=1 Tax=Streptococcus sobrinus TaxID=1310 RepID=UPI00031CF131|nr:hypothetical protein [Streptococcus sobrinus]